MLAEIARLEAPFDPTPRPEITRPTVVRQPIGSETPKNPKIYYCSITGDQSHLVAPVGGREIPDGSFRA